MAAVLAVGLFAHAASADEAEKAMARENFEQADANADGALDAVEFRAFIDLNAEDDLGKAARVKRFGRYDTAFGRADENADGAVTREEIAAMAE